MKFLVFAAMLSLLYMPGHAAVLTLDTFDDSVILDKPMVGRIIPNSGNYVNGSSYMTRFSENGGNFMTFSLRALTGNVVAAELRLPRLACFFSEASVSHYKMFDVSVDAVRLHTDYLLGDDLSRGIYNDIRSGNIYGELYFNNPEWDSRNRGTVDYGDLVDTITLSQAALDDINAKKGGYFSIGGYSGSGNVLFGGEGITTQYYPELVLTLADEEEVAVPTPEPSTLALLGIGLAGAAWKKRRRT
jgi:hypothetical protein